MAKFYRVSVLKKKNGWAYYFIDLTANNKQRGKGKGKGNMGKGFYGHPSVSDYS